jgi:DNA segregation ATPase FtsK/SpoIIIE, S-DNA-T family
MAKKKKQTLNLKPGQVRDIYAIVLAALALFIALSLFQSGGEAGRWVMSALRNVIGVGVYLVPVLLIAWALMFVVERWRNLVQSKGLGLGLIFLSLIAMVHLSVIEAANPATAFKPPAPAVIGDYGGYVGAILSYSLTRILGKPGAYIILAAVLLVGLVITAGVSLSDVSDDALERGKRKINDMRRKKRRAAIEDGSAAAALPADKKKADSAAARVAETIRIEETQSGASSPAGISPSVHDKTYHFPPLDLLRTASPRSDKAWKKNVNDRIKIVEDTLRDFGVEAVVAQVVNGPTVTRFELQLGSGVKVNRIISLSNDLALALASPDVRILAPVPGKTLVGVEVASEDKEMVTLGDVLRQAAASETMVSLTAGIGKDIGGGPVVVNLGHMPHLLISGATGSGKTTCVNSIITSLLFFSHPDLVKMILIDPKMVELNHYNAIPHLIAPVITNPKKASFALAWAVKEMEQRFKLMAEAGARNIEYYNENLKKDETRMPYLVIIIDELADLMMVAPSEVEDSICRLSQMGRAVGINLVVATQRPSVDVITGVIKANIPSRISFEVASQMDSRVILDMPGAEKLIGRGDMLFLPAGSVKPKRIQGAYLTEKEIADATAFVRAQREPDYNDELIAEEEQPAWSNLDYIDPLLDQAIEVVVRTGAASISMLQRRLRVGYSRAARLVDTMEERGIVGGADGSKPRVVLLSEEEFERLKNTDASE